MKKYQTALKKQFPVTLPPQKEQRMALKIVTHPLSLAKKYLKHVGPLTKNYLEKGDEHGKETGHNSTAN